MRLCSHLCKAVKQNLRERIPLWQHNNDEIHVLRLFVLFVCVFCQLQTKLLQVLSQIQTTAPTQVMMKQQIEIDNLIHIC